MNICSTVVDGIVTFSSDNNNILLITNNNIENLKTVIYLIAHGMVLYTDHQKYSYYLVGSKISPINLSAASKKTRYLNNLILYHYAI